MGAHAQTFQVRQINAKAFPEIQVIFEATNASGERVTSARIEDFTAIENKANCKIVKVTNPDASAKPVSLLIEIDISGSMTGRRLKLAKEVVQNIVDQMPMETSEVALTSFNDQEFVNCDFTQDPLRIKRSLDFLNTSGGTDFNQAYLSAPYGAFSIVQSARNRKFILFITDGMCTITPNDVVEKARLQNTSIFCVTLDLPMPEALKDVARRTGGAFLESIKSQSDLDNFYTTFLQFMNVNKFGSVTYQTEFNCIPKRDASLHFKTLQVPIQYEVPGYKTGDLSIDPSMLVFGKSINGKVKTLPVVLTSLNIPITITRIAVSGSLFKMADSLALPLTLKTGTSKQISVNMGTAGPGFVREQMTISTRECPDKTVNIFGGQSGQVRLICPKGGETLVVGTDTSIRWDGVRVSKRIAISYRPDTSKSWIPIGVQSGLIRPWLVPNDTGRRVQVKLNPLADDYEDLFLSSSIDNRGTPIKSLYFNQTGDKIVITDNFGTVKVWDTKTSKLNRGYNGMSSEIAFFANDDCLVSMSKDEINVTDPKMTGFARIVNRNKKIFVSYILPDNSEKLISFNIMVDKARSTRLWALGFNRPVMLFPKTPITAGALNPDGSKALTLDNEMILKLWDLKTGEDFRCSYQPTTINSVILSPNSKTALILEPTGLSLIDLTAGKLLYTLRNYFYHQFSRSGEMLLVRDENNAVSFFDCNSRRLLAKLANAQFYKCSSRGSKILYYQNDTLTYFDAAKQLPILKIASKMVKDASLNDADTKLMVVSTDNIIDLYDVEKNFKINSLTSFNKDIDRAFFSPDNKRIVAVMANNTALVYSPDENKLEKNAVSGYFSILSPKPVVQKTITFGDQYLQTPKEAMQSSFITNPTAYPVRIKKVEFVGGDIADFEIISNTYPLTLPHQSAKAEEFRFTPHKEGNRVATLRTITPTDTFLTTISGRGIVKHFDIVRNINFGKIKVFQHRDTLVTILRNRSNESLVITSLEQAGPDKQQFIFSVAGKVITVLPKDSLRIKIRFAPQYRGKTSGSLLVKMSESSEFQNIGLQGEGLASRSVYVYGKTLHGDSNEPVAADVICVDLVSGNVVKKVTTNQSGNYGFRLNTDRNYSLTAEKVGYLSTSENVDISTVTFADSIRKDIYLTPLRNGAMIRMNCIFFESAKAELLTTSKSELKRIAEMLNQHPDISLEIHGHTDSIGNDASNMLLSDNRATAVRNYLVERGIQTQRFTVKGFGESHPVAPNSTEEGRQLNRRVELMIVKSDK
jgi:outer membrane protein OmpA-like peptidoglycan-associated protein/WD40 repeat protein